MKRIPIKDTKRFLSPEKFRDFRETGPRTFVSRKTMRQIDLLAFAKHNILNLGVPYWTAHL